MATVPRSNAARRIFARFFTRNLRWNLFSIDEDNVLIIAEVLQGSEGLISNRFCFILLEPRIQPRIRVRMQLQNAGIAERPV